MKEYVFVRATNSCAATFFSDKLVKCGYIGIDVSEDVSYLNFEICNADKTFTQIYDIPRSERKNILSIRDFIDLFL